MLITYNIVGHYYLVMTVPPGDIMTGLLSSGPERRLGPGSGAWWLSMRKQVAHASPHSLRACPNPVVVPSEKIKLLRATEWTVREWAPRQRTPARPASRTSFHSDLSATPSSLTSSASSILQSSPQTPEALLPRLAQPRRPQSMREPIETRPPSPDLVKHLPRQPPPRPNLDSSSDDPLSDDFPHAPLLKSSHRLTKSASAHPPPRHDFQAFIAPTPRAGAIHHLPNLSPDTGFMSKSFSMASAPSRLNGASHLSRDESTNSTLHFGGQSRADPMLIDIESDDLFPYVKKCHKCPRIPLFRALAALPPELRLMERAVRTPREWPARPTSPFDVFESDSNEDEDDDITPGGPLSMSPDEGEKDIRAWLGEDQAWQLVPPPKPERAHHCSVCNTCVLKYDHHCIWLNRCIGLGNERHYVLLMFWMAVANVLISITGWPAVALAWHASTADRLHCSTSLPLVILTWFSAVILAITMVSMTTWQVRLISQGETCVESEENSYYRQLAWRRQHRFQNVYDLGPAQNLRLFFNTLVDSSTNPTAPEGTAPMARSVTSGSASSLGLHLRHPVPACPTPPTLCSRWKAARILWPVRVAPYSDGWHWAKRRGLGGRHAGIEADEELEEEDVY